MRYNLERGGGVEKIEVPEGFTFIAIPQPVKAPDGEMTLYRLEFFDSDGKSAGVIANIAAFYPKSFIPPKDEFANVIPNSIGWMKPAA